MMTCENAPAIFEPYMLDVYLGTPDDFDVDAIIEEATEINYEDGKRYWKCDIDLNEICAAHQL